MTQPQLSCIPGLSFWLQFIPNRRHRRQWILQLHTTVQRLQTSNRTPAYVHPSSSQWSLKASSIWGSSSKRRNSSIHPNLAVEGQLSRRLADIWFVLILRLRVPLRSIPCSPSSPFLDQLHALPPRLRRERQIRTLVENSSHPVALHPRHSVELRNCTRLTSQIVWERVNRGKKKSCSSDADPRASASTSENAYDWLFQGTGYGSCMGKYAP